MVSLHPIVFIIVGAIVSITSYFMTTKEYTYSFFLYIGIVFAIYGLVKWIIVGFKEKARHKKESIKKPHKLHLARHKAVYCYDCRIHMPVNYRFCPFCGRRVQ